MSEFHETKQGAKFYDVTLPRLAVALERIAGGLEALTQAVLGALPCAACEGTGRACSAPMAKCPKCGGTGKRGPG